MAVKMHILLQILAQACKWQVKKLPEKFAAQKLWHIVSRVCYEQNIN